MKTQNSKELYLNELISNTDKGAIGYIGTNGVWYKVKVPFNVIANNTVGEVITGKTYIVDDVTIRKDTLDTCYLIKGRHYRIYHFCFPV